MEENQRQQQRQNQGGSAIANTALRYALRGAAKSGWALLTNPVAIAIMLIVVFTIIVLVATTNAPNQPDLENEAVETGVSPAPEETPTPNPITPGQPE